MARTKTSHSLEQLPGGSETILVVDDDDAVRTLLRELLRMKGYTVLDARFNSGALMAAGRHPGTIHLMVADLMMPGINGRELGRRLEDLRPDMKILYISGYPKEVVFGKNLLEEGAHFLEKPIAPESLLIRVRNLLDTESPSTGRGGEEESDDFVMSVLTGLLDRKDLRLSAQQTSHLKTVISDYEQNRLVYEADFMVAELHAHTLIQDDSVSLSEIETAFRKSEGAQTFFRLEGVKALRAAEAMLTTLQREKVTVAYPHGRRRTSDRLRMKSSKS